MAGRLQKPPAARQGHRRQPGDDREPLKLVPKPKALRIPACPRRDGELLHTVVRALWGKVWRSLAATQEWDSGDQALLTRWALTFDSWMEVDARCRKAPVVKGSQGQPRPNPLFGERARLDEALRAIEDLMGLTVASRVRFGILADPAPAADGDAPVDFEEFVDPEGVEIVETGA